MKLNTAKRLIIVAAMLATLAASSVNAAPAPAPAPAPAQRICTAWLNQCIQYRYIFGIRYCTVHQFTCIRWL